MRKSDDMFNRVMSKDHVAVVCLLENPSTGSRLIIANVHIEWNQIFRDVKLVQTAMLVEEIEKIAAQFAKFPPMLIADPSPAPPTSSSNDDPTTTTNDPSSTSSPPLSAPAPKTTRGPSYSDATKIPLVICGDFNSVPGSGVYEFLSSGQVPRDHEDFMDHVYGVYTEEGLSHKLGLKSAYSSIGELSLTNFTPSFEGGMSCFPLPRHHLFLPQSRSSGLTLPALAPFDIIVIDYIWYSTNSLAVTSLLGEIDPNYLSKVVGFPNAHFPSEYVSSPPRTPFLPSLPTRLFFLEPFR
jgi:CCR4-NOT transcription complex subunit 6